MGAIYAEPREINNPENCYFYHTMEIPGHGLVKGEWDIRRNTAEYFGNYDFRGKRILEVGTASGFLCFWMEAKGAEVVGYDLSKDYDWDVVPFAGMDWKAILEDRKQHIDKLNNAWWFTHRAHNACAKVVYGTVYNIPKEIGPVDACTISVVLPHLRDPFHAMYNALRLTKETAIIVGVPQKKNFKRKIMDWLDTRYYLPSMHFRPEYRTKEPWDAYWMIPETVTKSMLGVLGFGKTTVNYHRQIAFGQERELFTIVATRTHGEPEV